MKSDTQLIEEARRNKIPSIGFAREIETIRRGYLRCMNEEERSSKIKALEDTVRLSTIVNNFRWFIVTANFVFGFASLLAYVFVLLFGYDRFVAPAFDLPAVSAAHLFLTVFIVKYAWKGFASAAYVEKHEAETKLRKGRLWLDNTKREAKTNLHNFLNAGVVLLLSYLFTFTV